MRVDAQIAQFLDPSSDVDIPVRIPVQETGSTTSRVEVAVKALGKLESEVIGALFPPSGASPASLEEVAKNFGMSIDEVQNVADEALRGLRGRQAGVNRVSKAWN